MIAVVPIGGNSFRFDILNDTLKSFGLVTMNHGTVLAKLSSLFSKFKDEETLIRNSTCYGHVILSFMIAANHKKFLQLHGWGVRISHVAQEEELTLAICTGNLLEWQNCIRNLLNWPTTNEIGESLLSEIDKMGYGGIFHQYTRSKQGDQLKLTYKP